MEYNDLEQRVDILEILEKQVIFLENTELAASLAPFKTGNVQWVLNILQDTLGELQDALDLEDFSQNWS
jgi:hypothetical protein